MAVGSGTFVISGAGTVTGGSLTSGSSGVLGPRGDFTVSGGATVAAGALQTAGTGSIGGAGTFTASSFTVSAGTSGNATTTLAGNLTVSGDCTVNNVNSTWAVLKLGSSTLSCGGAFSVSTAGLATTYGSFFYGESGTLTVTGLASVLNYGIVASSTSAFYGNTATLNFNGGLKLVATPSLSSTPHNAIFHAGTSGTMTVTGGLNIYNSQSFGAFGQTIFDGGGKDITISGALFADSLGTDAIIINAGTSGTLTVSGTSTIFKVEGTGAKASTTFNGQSKNLVFTNGVTVLKTGGASGEVFYTPSTGTNSYDFTLNKAGGSLSFATTSTVTGGLTVTAGTLYINGTTTITGDISNSDTIIINYPLKKTSSASFNSSSYLTGTDGSITITLTDKNRNMVGTSTETLSVTVTAGNDSEALTLTETGVATGIFTGTLSLSQSSSPVANNGTVEVSTAGGLSLSYTDTGDSSDTASASASITVPAGGVPIFFGTNTPLFMPGQISQQNLRQETNTQTIPITIVTAPPSPLSTLSGPFIFGQISDQTRLLQEYLSKDKTIYPEGKVTGYYGPLTKKAVGRFQERYALAKAGDSFFGLAGPKTRAKIMEVLGTKTQTKEALIFELTKKIEELQKQINILLQS
jgi:hypothetical protein